MQDFDVTEAPADEFNVTLDLSEIAAGGELGGTMDAPTVDATHSGSAHHTRSHAITGASDHSATAWRLFYSDAGGAVQEVGLGTNAQLLMSNGAAAAPSFQNHVRYLAVRVLAADTDHAVDTTVGGDFEMPFAGTITEIGAYVDTAGVTGLATIDVNKGGATIISTKITIDSAEKTSRSAATAPVLSDTALAVGSILTVDIDGIQTTPAKGLTVRLAVRMI